MKLKNVINKHKSNKIKENSDTVRHLNNGTDHRHSKSCCDKSSPARRTMSWILRTWIYKYIYIYITYMHIQGIYVWNNWYLRTTPEMFNKTYELLNLIALEFLPVIKINIFQCMGKIFCVEFQRNHLKFHIKHLTHTLKDMTFFMPHSNFKSS